MPVAPDSSPAAIVPDPVAPVAEAGVAAGAWLGFDADGVPLTPETAAEAVVDAAWVTGATVAATEPEARRAGSPLWPRP